MFIQEVSHDEYFINLDKRLRDIEKRLKDLEGQNSKVTVTEDDGEY